MGDTHAETHDMQTAAARPGRLLWAFAALILVASAGLSTLVLGLGVHHSGFAMPWWGLALGAAVVSFYPLYFRFRGETHAFSVDEIVLVLGLFLVSARGVVVAELLACLVVYGLVRRIPPLKLTYNFAQLALGTVSAVLVFHAIAGTSGPHQLRAWVAALLACATFAIVGALAVSAAIAVMQGRVAVSELASSILFGIASAVVNAMLGLVAVIMLSDSPLAVALLVGPIVVVFVAYRAYLSEQAKSRGLQFLYDASQLLSGARDLETGLLALLDFARDTFHAELAEVALLGAPDEKIGYRTHSGPGDSSSRLEPVNIDDLNIVLEATAGTDAQLVRPEAGSPLAVRDGMHVASMLIATLVDESGVRGAVFVARRKGAAFEVFDKNEMRLFETFANHLATTMEKQSLSTSLAQLRMLKQELAHQAYHDSLTGLANRLKFRDLVESALAAAARDTGKIAVMFIDLDDFKTVNDTMGHAAGDRLLEEVAWRIAASVGDFGTAARLGGDEFAVVLPIVSNDSDVRVVADRILVALGDPVLIEGQAVVAQASIGIASHVGAADAAELMQHADVAMYTAKRNGKGRFDEFEPNMSLSVARRHQLKLGLERAIANNEFSLEYQPIVAVSGGNAVATEALLRWKDPTRGLMPPTEFVGIAEETGLIVPIGRFVMQESCRQAAEWQATTGEHVRVFVNLSTRQLAHPDLVDDVCNALEDAGLDPSHLVLEVTETAMMRDIDEARETLLALKRLGVVIAIDDFGTGYSSLSYLRQLPIDVLKIAKPIVDAICESSEDAAFVKGIIELGHVVGMKVVAEGVEHVEQYAHLVDMGCDYVQGHYYAPSMEPSAIASLLGAATFVPVSPEPALSDAS